MPTRPERLKSARDNLDHAIQSTESAHRAWSECVTELHMAELELRKAQKHMRFTYNVLGDLLNHDGGEAAMDKGEL